MLEPREITWKDIIHAIAQHGDVWLLLFLVVIVLSFHYVIRPSMELFRETVTFYNNQCLERINELTTQVQILRTKIEGLTEKIDELLRKQT